MALRPVPGQSRPLPLVFPARGIDVAGPFGQQPPGSTPTGQNVRLYEPRTMRARGGQRPGLEKYVAVQIAGASLIQELNSVIGSGYVAPGS